MLLEEVRFFDHYLKGIDNGIDKEPPIYLYVMHGDGWRFEKEWPLARQEIHEYFLGPDGTLQPSVGPAGGDKYKADFTTSSTYGSNHANRWLGIGADVPNALPVRTDEDMKCQVYTSDPMTADMEVTGHPIIHLSVSSTASHGDFFFYLEDVDETGKAVLVSEGELRAGFAALHNNDDIITNADHHIDVLPDVPWHGYKKSEYQDAILANGKVVELVVDFLPTSWVFQKGHRIRVSLACANYPTFRLNPKLSPANKADASDNIVPTITIHRGPKYRSRVILPVIPAR